MFLLWPKHGWQRSEFCKLRFHCVVASLHMSSWSKLYSLHANLPEASRYEVLCYRWHYFLRIPPVSGFYSNNMHLSHVSLYILKTATTTHTSPSFLCFGFDVRRALYCIYWTAVKHIARNINTAQIPTSLYIYVQIIWSETTEWNGSQSGNMYSVEENVKKKNSRNKQIKKKKKTNTHSWS